MSPEGPVGGTRADSEVVSSRPQAGTSEVACSVIAVPAGGSSWSVQVLAPEELRFQGARDYLGPVLYSQGAAPPPSKCSQLWGQVRQGD